MRHLPSLYYCNILHRYVCLAIGITFPIIRRRIPKRPIFSSSTDGLTWQDVFPPIPIVGICFFVSYSGQITTMIIVSLIYNVYIKSRHAEWYVCLSIPAVKIVTFYEFSNTLGQVQEVPHDDVRRNCNGLRRSRPHHGACVCVHTCMCVCLYTNHQHHQPHSLHVSIRCLYSFPAQPPRGAWAAPLTTAACSLRTYRRIEDMAVKVCLDS